MRDLIKNFILLTALVFVYISSASKAAELPVIVLSESNTVILRGPVTGESIAAVGNKVIELNRSLPKDKNIILVLDTPGGSISAGNELIELIEGLPRKVVTVTIFAASMGYQIAQALDTRYILQTGTLMSHRAAIGGLGGQVPGEANSRLNWITQAVELMEKKTSKRVGMSLKEYKEAIRDELWLTGENAVRQNHADQVVRALCDDSLSGTEEVDINTMFGTVKATVSKCPIISGPLAISGENKLSKDPMVLKNIRREVNEFFAKTKGIWTY